MTISRAGEGRSALGKSAYLALWLLSAGFLAFPSWAQKCSGLSRFVLITGLVSLYLAWPRQQRSRGSLGTLLGLVPLLCLAWILDRQAGLHGERAYWLAGHGVILCLASAFLSVSRGGRWHALRGLLFGFWYLLPLAIGLWSHLAAGSSLHTSHVLSWSPIGSFWRELPLLRSEAPGLDLQRNLPLLLVSGVCIAALGLRGIGAREDFQ
ncbi:MAG: hypothetical protein GY930_18185 [bacterium]|nr:hypothetical protein [bacterium]